MTLGLITAQDAYWNGGPLAVQAYGPRCHFDATSAPALLSARGPAELTPLVALRAQRDGLDRECARPAGGMSVLPLVAALPAVSVSGFAPLQLRHDTRFYNVD